MNYRAKLGASIVTNIVKNILTHLVTFEHTLSTLPNNHLLDSIHHLLYGLLFNYANPPQFLSTTLFPFNRSSSIVYCPNLPLIMGFKTYGHKIPSVWKNLTT